MLNCGNQNHLNWQRLTPAIADSQSLAVQSFHYVFPYVEWVINGPQNVTVIILDLYIFIKEIFIGLFSLTLVVHHLVYK